MKALSYIIVIIMSVTFLLVAGSNYQQSAAEREWARAAMVREQSQARSDLLAAALPYVAITGVMVFGGAVLVAVIVFGLKFAGGAQGQPPQLQVIERHTIVLLPEGAGRHRAWQNVAEYQKMLVEKTR